MGKGRRRRPRVDARFTALMIVLAIGLLCAGWFLDHSGLTSLTSASAGALRALRFSEAQNRNVLTLSNGSGNAPGWIELENSGDVPLSLKGVCITRDTRVNRTFVLPDITLEPHAYLLIYADGQAAATPGELHAPFRLPGSGGTTLYLYDTTQELLDSVTLPAMKSDESLCRDTTGEWVVTSIPTPGDANRVSGSRAEAARNGDVTVNEIISSNVAVFPDERGEYPDYIELINLSAHEVDLEGYCLTDSAAKPDKWRFPRVVLPAGSVLAVHCSGEDRRDDPTHLHAAFRLSAEETVYLAQPNGDIVCAVTVPTLDPGQAFSRLADGDWTMALPPTPNRENTVDAAMALDGERHASREGGVYISEVMTLPDDNKPDWVELYNSGDSDVDLSGFGLSNRLKHARKWEFPAGTVIPAKSYLAVFLAGADGTAPKGYLSAPFALNGGGGALVLCTPAGAILDFLYLPQQYLDITFGRSDSGACGYLPQSTPLAANGSQVLLSPAAGAEYSVRGGLHAAGESFSVSLSAALGARVYYTLDCTDPSEEKALYDGTPIPVNGTTILRTRVYQDGRLPSFMDTQSYLFDVHAASEVPYVVSLVSDPDGLFSDERGIMVKGPNATEKFPFGDTNKGANFWMDWEREAHVELFTGSGENAVSQECGIKIHGRNTRAYELKSFKVKANGRYGADYFHYPIFHERPYDEYEAFVLRYSGQDFKYTFMRDAVLTDLASNTSVMYMEAEECICYLNGEYYSAMYIRENISPFSLARREGWVGQEQSLDLVKSGFYTIQGSNESYLALKAYLESHDNASQEVYDKIAAEVDIDNFIQYITMEIVYDPPDTVNVKRYRNTDADGKWRWVIYDLDRAMRGGENAADSFALLAQGTNAQLFRAFMANSTLRDRFLDNLNAALSTYLSSQSLTDAVKAQYERLQPLLPDYLQKVGVSEKNYKGYIKSLLNAIRKRPALVLDYCAAYLHLSAEEMRARFADTYAAIEAFGA